jgi:hypothetical protein
MRLTEWDLFEEVVPRTEGADKRPGFQGRGMVSSGVRVVVTFAVVAGSAWSMPSRSEPIATSTILEVSRSTTFSASADRQPRGPRDLHQLDTTHGRSSRKLAKAFDDYFVPAVPDEAHNGDDYSFF